MAPGYDTLTMAFLDVLADLVTTALLPDAVVSETDVHSLQSITHALMHLPVPPSAVLVFQGVFRHLCSHSQGMNAVLAFCAFSLPVHSEWSFEHVVSRMRVVYESSLDDQGEVIYRDASDS